MPRPHRWQVDLGVAIAFTAVTEYEIWVGPIPFLEGSVQGPKAGFALAALLLGVALAIRRRWPVAAAGFVGAAALLGPVFLRLQPGTASMFELFLTPLFMSYSTGANTTGRRTVAAALLMGIPLLINQILHWVLNVPPRDLQQAAGEWLFYGAVFLAGKALQRLRTHARHLTETREHDIEAAVREERARIAREMHDVVAHGVSVMVLQAGAARQTLESRPDRAREALSAAEATGRETLSELRRLLEILKPAADSGLNSPQPSLQDLDRLVQQLHEGGLNVSASIQGDLTSLPKGVDAAAYRIVQEALTNALKHARPTEVNVQVCRASDQLRLEVRNNGHRASRKRGRGQGQGLIGMRERALAYGGRLEAAELPDGGFHVLAEIPCPSA